MSVNPTVGAWVFVILANLMHLTFMATFAFRYLSISDGVPDAPELRGPRPAGALAPGAVPEGC